MVRDCAGLAQVSCTVMYAYVAPHTSGCVVDGLGAKVTH